MELKGAVEKYVIRKRLMGRRYENNCKELNMFARANPRLALSEVRTTHVSRFLNSGRLLRQTWIGRYSRLRAFFLYWMAKHEIHRLPMPRSRRRTKQMFSPYIFSRSAIRKMLRNATIQDRKLTMVRPETFRALIILLYGTGIASGEALALRIRDFDLESRSLTLTARIGPPRTIPLGPDLVEMLRKYTQHKTSADDYLFATRDGRRIPTHRLKVTFRRIRRISAIRRTDGSPFQPTLRDLRHTFAVHRIADWYERGADIELMLPKLAAYMGLFTAPLINRYLPLVPAHFKQQVSKLSERPVGELFSKSWIAR
jgi:integrase/recombinase XerD